MKKIIALAVLLLTGCASTYSKQELSVAFRQRDAAIQQMAQAIYALQHPEVKKNEELKKK